VRGTIPTRIDCVIATQSSFVAARHVNIDARARQNSSTLTATTEQLRLAALRRVALGVAKCRDELT
jgi:hypothetical protein